MIGETTWIFKAFPSLEAKISKRQLLEIHPFTATLAENSQKFYGMIWKHGGDFASTVHSEFEFKMESARP